MAKACSTLESFSVFFSNLLTHPFLNTHSLPLPPSPSSSSSSSSFAAAASSSRKPPISATTSTATAALKAIFKSSSGTGNRTGFSPSYDGLNPSRRLKTKFCQGLLNPRENLVTLGLDLTCQTVADMIKGKTPEEIRKRFIGRISGHSNEVSAVSMMPVQLYQTSI